MTTKRQLMTRRQRLLGPAFPTFYDDPVHIVEGKGVWLWDKDGQKFLDCYNNVPHVGHGHPAVVEAIAVQAARLNTHTRYLHEGILDYLDRLMATFDGSMDSGIMVCSGSEANDIALRMAQVATGKMGIIATDNTYHGNTALVSQIGSRSRPVGGYASFVRHVPSPVGTNTSYCGVNPDEDQQFAESIQKAIASLEADGHGCAALIICPYFANEGFPSVESGFLNAAAEVIRNAGGLLIADEVQPGFGRLGDCFWGHQRLGVSPDIVTMGKPMANGHPVAAVVSSEKLVGKFRNEFRYFNTFGGNPVAMAAANATLSVIAEEGLVKNALGVGKYARAGLRLLADRYPSLGVVRGCGLFFGVEILKPDGQPNVGLARRIPNALRIKGVLISTTGKHGTVLKIRPPMPIGKAEIDLLLHTLGEVLEELE